MKHERVTEDIRELAALYSLGALSQHEARGFELHLREGCSVCNSELRQFEGVIAGIGFGVAEAEPPDYLRELLAARLQHEEPPAQDSVSPLKGANAPVQDVPFQSKPIFRSPSREGHRLFPWGAAAALALVVLFVLYSWKLSQDTNAHLREQIAAAQADAEDLRALLEVQEGRSDELEQVMSLVSTPGARVILLAGQTPAPSASAAVFWDVAGRQCLVLGHFPPAPDGKAYQLWFFSPDGQYSAGLLELDPTGRIFTSVSITRDVDSVSAAAVTLEPDNGSQLPTLPFYAVWRQ